MLNKPTVRRNPVKMKFFSQITSNSCQVIAIKTVLSDFDIYLSDKEIEKALPKHTFGNLITEIGVYFNNLGFKTKLFSNVNNFETKNIVFLKSLNEYKLKGEFIDKEIEEDDIKDNPVILNINWYSVKNSESKKRSGHYVVVKKLDNEIKMFDGSNYKEPVQVNFEDLKSFSKNINNKDDVGMWLEVSKII